MRQPSTHELYLGVLTALRAHRSCFMASGDRFHAAFGSMVDALDPSWTSLAEELRGSHDPMFGVYKAAEDMVLQGMVGFALSLEFPRNTTARLTLAPEQAKRELDEETEAEHAQEFRRLAKVLHDQL